MMRGGLVAGSGAERNCIPPAPLKTKIELGSITLEKTTWKAMERKQRRRLSAEEKWNIYQECEKPGIKIGEVLRKTWAVLFRPAAHSKRDKRRLPWSA